MHFLMSVYSVYIEMSASRSFFSLTTSVQFYLVYVIVLKVQDLDTIFLVFDSVVNHLSLPVAIFFITEGFGVFFFT